ncbi:PhzF family phenazine biosynthesis isomerase [Leifsonia shinshuensis]|uniref:PhzF family phenazine biosynthesis protein n=1 Tax=Leifsonia shinshuensis TaxID=150026 RepID=UPI0028583326|nr:PhzF family phenazine biosynthesis isomerase [Leifsonia shinshuensis]MDR6972807.1 PhzF family phenazine biosynthesis protein [Leifsonia shinshuensis]
MEILSYRAFTTPADRRSGNPAGVVIDADALERDEMLAIATELGFSETAFLMDVTPGLARVRYFTPRDEIAFCGHATIASGVALARRGAGETVTFATRAGAVPVAVDPRTATLTAVETDVHPLDEVALGALLEALRLRPADLDPALPPAFVRGGNPHPLLFVVDGVLPALDHDDEAVLAVQNRFGWDGTVPVVRRCSAERFVSRNPFPRGGIREDPATGSAAAGLGSYLRAGGHVATPATIHVEQGAETGHPSLIEVHIPVDGRIRVTGTAEEL